MKNFVFYLSAFLILSLLSNIPLSKSLDFLEDQSNTLIEFEFSSSCGNSYITNQRISSDIVNEIRKNGITKLEFKILNNNYNDKNIKDKSFKIYMIKAQINSVSEVQRILLATSNLNSDKYFSILEKYPMNLINNNSQASQFEESKQIRSEFINVLITKIKENL